MIPTVKGKVCNKPRVYQKQVALISISGRNPKLQEELKVLR